MEEQKSIWINADKISEERKLYLKYAYARYKRQRDIADDLAKIEWWKPCTREI